MAISSINCVDERIISDIRRSVKDTADRGLIIASKWSSEVLMSIPASKRNSTKTSPDTSLSSMHDDLYDDGDNVSKWLIERGRISDEREEDFINAARRCMETRQYHRAYHLVRQVHSAKARFISVYCRFIISEKKALSEWHKLDGTRHQPPVPVNTMISDFLGEVESSNDPWLQFLEGLFLKRLSRVPEALQVLYDSISAYPWNWSAWLLLGSCLESAADLTGALASLKLPLDHPSSQLFQIKIMNELHSSTEAEVKLCDKLLSEDYFPESLWLMGQRGRALYDLLDFPQAITQFENILDLDPHRIDDMDIFSNILYTTHRRNRLATLAEKFLVQDQDRPEICCIIGNYYSLRTEHEKAAKYFRRATHLDRTCIQAWTLMGSGYYEMGNAPAAIEAYRRALDINKKDYRPWLGLGQVYNMMNLYSYSVHYFQQAARLRPTEAYIWEGLDNAFSSIGSLADAVACRQRAILHYTADADPSQKLEMRNKLIVGLRELKDTDKLVDAQLELLMFLDREGEVDFINPFPDKQLGHIAEVAKHHARAPNGNLKLAKDFIRLYTAYDEYQGTFSATAIMLKTLIPEVMAKAMSIGCVLTDEDAPLHGFSMAHREHVPQLERWLKQRGKVVEY